ncbi:MAG: Txe/YoeB family addiction module toxin [Selenomonadaceae bacterium]|nr:Txe/YoeB family addiction module toxin [Selenomonadaceae bacterium]
MQDRKTLRKINELIKDILRNGTQGLGKAELLKHIEGGWYSRRIDRCNRLVFRICGDYLEIIQCKEHYKIDGR